jgi:quercetin dioxygenase-like cupin family protein
VSRSEGSEYARQKHYKSQLSECNKGRFGQKYLASGIRISMRLWESEQPAEAKREYETAGFVIEGKAELHIEGQLVLLEKGDSWVVPKGARRGCRCVVRTVV